MLSQVADELNTSVAQVRALIRSGELKAIQIGGRGEWRVERVQLEAYIQQAYAGHERTWRPTQPWTEPAGQVR
jgi:prophage regulatory protein